MKCINVTNKKHFKIEKNYHFISLLLFSALVVQNPEIITSQGDKIAV